jgi:hypothetical protein
MSSALENHANSMIGKRSMAREAFSLHRYALRGVNDSSGAEVMTGTYFGKEIPIDQKTVEHDPGYYTCQQDLPVNSTWIPITILVTRSIQLITPTQT